MYLKGYLDVQEEKVSITYYNILPLGSSEPVMEIPEVIYLKFCKV